MTDKIIIDGKEIGCPCYIDRPLYRYDKGCWIQSRAFTEQQTKEKPILRCDEIQNCPIKEQYKQLKRKEQKCEKFDLEAQEYYNTILKLDDEIKSLREQLQAEKEKVEELEKQLSETKFFDLFADEIMAKLNTNEMLANHFQKLTKYKQALEEIKQELEEATYCENQECGCDDAQECLTCLTKQILQKCEVLDV